MNAVCATVRVNSPPNGLHLCNGPPTRRAFDDSNTFPFTANHVDKDRQTVAHNRRLLRRSVAAALGYTGHAHSLSFGSHRQTQPMFRPTHNLLSRGAMAS